MIGIGRIMLKINKKYSLVRSIGHDEKYYGVYKILFPYSATQILFWKDEEKIKTNVLQMLLGLDLSQPINYNLITIIRFKGYEWANEQNLAKTFSSNECK